MEITEEVADMVIQKLLQSIDKKKLIDSNQTLIEDNNGTVSVTGFEGEVVSTDSFEVELYHQNPDNEEHFKNVRKLVFTILSYIGVDTFGKYKDFSFDCGLVVNSDNSAKELDNIISRELQTRLQESGYEIIKIYYD